MRLPKSLRRLFGALPRAVGDWTCAAPASIKAPTIARAAPPAPSSTTDCPDDRPALDRQFEIGEEALSVGVRAP